MPSVQEDFESLAAFRYALRRFLRFSEQAARRVGLTPQQHQALLAIQGFPGRDRITIKELAERLQVAHHSAVGIVDRLARRRLLLREKGAEDKRCVLIGLTAQGRGLLSRLTKDHKEQLAELAPELLRVLRSASAGRAESSGRQQPK